MKRILCLVSSMDAGGAETFLMKLYRNMDRNLYQMDFAVNVKEPAFYDEEILNMGGKIHYIPPKTRDIIGFTKELYNLVKDKKYQYVLRVTSNGIGFYDLLIAKKAGAKVCAARSSNSSDGGRMLVQVANHIARILFLRYVDVMIAPSDLAAEYTFGKRMVRKGKVHFLKNAIDLREYAYSEQAREEIRKEFGIGQAPLIGHIGRFAEQKNHRFLIEIFKNVQQEIPESKLLLVGEGEMEPEIRALVQEKGLERQVIFSGVRKDISKLLSAMDVFVLPSLYEGMPNVIIEAQATGLPCVIADTITKEADLTGMVSYVPLREVKAWQRELKEILSEGKERHAQERVMRECGYDIECEVQKFLSFF